MFTVRRVTVAVPSGIGGGELELAAAISATARAALRVVVVPAAGATRLDAGGWVDRVAAAHPVARVSASPDGSADALVAELVREPSDLLVKAASAARPGVRGLRDLDRRLVHVAGCALLLLRPGSPVRRVAAAIRLAAPGDRQEQERRDLDVVGAAELLSRAAGAELHVLHGWLPRGDALGGGRPRDAARARRAQRVELRGRIGAWLCRARVPLHPRRIHALRGLPEDVLAAGPARLRADVLVIGGPLSACGLRSRLLSMADHLLPGATCSLLVLSRRPATAPAALGVDARAPARGAAWRLLRGEG